MGYSNIDVITLIAVLGSAGWLACDRNAESGQDLPREGSESQVVEHKDDNYETPFPRNDWECSAENVGRLQDWIDEVAGQSGVFEPQSIEALPVVAGPGVERDWDLTVEVTRDEVQITGRPAIETSTAIEDPITLIGHVIGGWGQLEETFEWNRRDESKPALIGVAVDEDVSGQVATDILTTVAGEMLELASSPMFVALFDAPSPEGVEPVPDKLVKRYEALIPEPAGPEDRPRELNRRTDLDRALEEAVEDCPEIEERLELLPEAKPSERPELVHRALVEGWEGCHCAPDIELLLVSFVSSGEMIADVSIAPLIYRSEKWKIVVGDGEYRAIDEERRWGQSAPEAVENSLGPMESVKVASAIERQAGDSDLREVEREEKGRTYMGDGLYRVDEPDSPQEDVEIHEALEGDNLKLQDGELDLDDVELDAEDLDELDDID